MSEHKRYIFPICLLELLETSVTTVLRSCCFYKALSYIQDALCRMRMCMGAAETVHLYFMAAQRSLPVCKANTADEL